ncbi:MAG TPA: ABC transporter permease [Vicinamibacterales bacterium]|nr:ABC transporter permease [Vicinamibacterales bacterium]
MLSDLGFGARQLVRRPGFAAAAILSLAFGIGLNTTLFSIVNAVLVRGGPIAQPDRLVEIYTGLDKDYPQLTTSYPDYLDLAASVDSLSGIAAHAYVRGILSSTDRASLLTGEAVSANYFDLLGLRPQQGRGFRADENDAPGGEPVVVVSHGLWQSRFAGRADVVGQTIRLSGVTYTIVGVGPAGFNGTLPGIQSDFWVPAMMIDQLQFSGVQSAADNDPGQTRLEQRGTRWLFLKGRLKDGRTVEQARAEVDATFARLRQAFPVTNAMTTSSVVASSGVRFHPMLDGYLQAAGAALLGAVSLVLLVACANVANMLLARAATRRREFAIRAAIGASRARLLRQLLAEGVVLAAAGGAAGLLFAWWAGRAVGGLGLGILPVPVSFDFTIDRTVLLFAIAASLVTALTCSLVPAWSASKPALVPDLKATAERRGRRRLALSDVLVIGQLALSLVLLIAGSLLTRGLVAARDTDLGFDPNPVSSLTFNLQMNGYDLDRAMAFRERAIETLAALPGVTAVSTATRLPLAPDISAEGVLVPGRHQTTDQATITDSVNVGAGYFTTVGVPLVAGRAFTEDDVRQNRKVAIVNETMARLYWPDGSALGRHLHTAGFDSPPLEIVGISRDHKVRSVGESPRAYLHLPATRSRTINLVVRTATSAEASLPALRQALWSLEPDILFTEDVAASEVAATTMAPTKIGAAVLGAFGLLALVLAAVGLYGVIAYSVSQRTREVGIRLALGADRRRVLTMVMVQGGRLALGGILVGALGAALVARLLDSMLYGVSGLDPVAYVAAAGMLLLVALLANLVPAMAAARIDPVKSLRAD